MTRSKKLFAALSVVFLIGLIYASYDIGKRTTFPGSKPQLQERIKKQFLPADSSKKDSLKSTHR
jgi:hypothetical protein